MLSVSAGGIYFNFVILYGLVSPDSEVSDLHQDEWRPFSPEVLKEAHVSDTTVMIDFTAKLVHELSK